MTTLMSSTGLSPLQRAFNSFLLTMPPRQLEELVEYLQNTRARENGQSTKQFECDNQTPLEYTIPDDTASGKQALNFNRGSVAPANPAPKSSASRKRTRDKPLRPLNSFIAFRSFYSTIFPDLTQKAKSGILRFLWQNDPFKAKWAILAKAYSKVRDEHSNSNVVSLETFLSLNAGFIGIIGPKTYLEVMGWELTVDDDQQYTMARVSQTAPKETDVSTNYSVNDVVKHCYDTGYVSQKGRQSRICGKNNEAVMSFVAQPSSVVNESNNIKIPGSNTFVDNFDDAKAAIISSPGESAEDTPTPAFSDMSSIIDEPSPRSAELPNEQNPLRFMDDAGIEFNWGLLANNVPDRNTHYDGLIPPPLYSAPTNQANIPCIPPGLETLEGFDFDQFVNF